MVKQASYLVFLEMPAEIYCPEHSFLIEYDVRGNGIGQLAMRAHHR